MRYVISRNLTGSPGSIEIEKEEYYRIKKSRNNLFEALYLEEKIDLVMENFCEYENELLLLASRIMIFRDDDYFSMSQKKNAIIRRIINLLSACRLYLDQCLHHVKMIYGEQSDQYEIVRKEKADKYDRLLGYRIMEELRNYSLHRGFPIHEVAFSHKRLGNEKDSRFLSYVVPKIDVSVLENDKKFKKAILNDLKTFAREKRIDIRPYVRDYIEGIGMIHERIRTFLSSDIERWEKNIENTISKFIKKYGEEKALIGLAIIIEDEDQWLEIISIFRDFIKRRKSLEEKNWLFNNFRKRFASNEIIAE